MDHLTIDEIITFVSLTELNEEAIELSTAVNTHICKCRECFELVNKFQEIHDEFSDMSLKKEFLDHLYDNLKNGNKNTTEQEVGKLEDSL